MSSAHTRPNRTLVFRHPMTPKTDAQIVHKPCQADPACNNLVAMRRDEASIHVPICGECGERYDQWESENLDG